MFKTCFVVACWSCTLQALDFAIDPCLNGGHHENLRSLAAVLYSARGGFRPSTGSLRRSPQLGNLVSHVRMQSPVNTTWSDVGIECNRLMEGLVEKLGILGPNALQARSVPAILQGEDVILSSYTGSGKTLAGALPLIYLMQKRLEIGSFPETSMCSPHLLIITPTRELTLQFLRVLEVITSSCPKLKSVKEKDFLLQVKNDNLPAFYSKEAPNIVVGSPKDLDILYQRRAVDFDQVRYIMMDEVDLLVDDSLKKLETVLELLPDLDTQTVLASASALAHPAMNGLIEMLSPSHQIIGSPGIDKEGDEDMRLPPTLEHTVIEIKKYNEWTSSKKFPEQAWPHKLKVLIQLLKTRSSTENIMVFVNKKRGAYVDLSEALKDAGFSVSLLSGLRKSRERNRLAQEMNEVEGKIVIATDDVAARGLDYESVRLVVNFDAPYSAKNYLHRAGRAGRAGRQGSVISLISNEKELRFLQEKILGRFGSFAKSRTSDEFLEESKESVDKDKLSAHHGNKVSH